MSDTIYNDIFYITLIGGDEDEERMFSPYEYLMGALKGNQTPDSARYDSPDPTGFTSVDFLMEQIGKVQFPQDKPRIDINFFS